jgi:hypothetical protein
MVGVNIGYSIPIVTTRRGVSVSISWTEFQTDLVGHGDYDGNEFDFYGMAVYVGLGLAVARWGYSWSYLRLGKTSSSFTGSNQKGFDLSLIDVYVGVTIPYSVEYRRTCCESTAAIIGDEPLFDFGSGRQSGGDDDLF